MSWAHLEIAVVLALVAAVFVAFVRERMPPDVVAMTGVAVLLATGILGTSEVLAVFGNHAPITVACMFVLSGALERTGMIDAIGRAIAQAAVTTPRLAVLALLLGAMVISAFINNTPVVVILTPIVIAMAGRLRIAPSKLLIPLSFASIFGGTTTLIGTSTNLLVDGVAQGRGLAPFGMFEITVPSLAMAAMGIAYLVLVGRWLLPDRTTFGAELVDAGGRQFLAEVLVPQDSPLVGKTLRQARLSDKQAFTVVDLIRHDVSLRARKSDTVLEPGDRIVLRTNLAEVMGLRAGGGVTFAPGEHVFEPIGTRDTRIMEGIVGPRSRFVGRRVADLRLRRLYGVYILAIHRQNETLSGNFDQLRLGFGDTLLLEGPPEGLKRLFERQDLINLSEPRARPFRREKAWIAVTAILAVMALAALDLLPIAGLAMMAAAVVVATRCIDPDEAYETIGWRILMLIFGMLALGRAMDRTGAAALIVGTIAGAVAGFGPVVVLSLVYVVTSILTEIVSNNAAAILLTPIAVGLAGQLGVDPRPFAVAVMYAASASFATPIGYQTNTFVYHAGGYRFTDFVRVGLPLNLLMWATATVVIPLWWPL
jgi:di/tricarboxylate transporter